MYHIATFTALFIGGLAICIPSIIHTLPVRIPNYVVIIFYVLLLVRWPVGPFILAKLSKGNAVISSVSLRSIKGIRFSIRNLAKVEIDRLGYSVHLFRRKANRGFGLTVDGLKITVLRAPPTQPSSARRRRSSTKHDFPNLDTESSQTVSPPVAWLTRFFPQSWVHALDGYFRAWIRGWFRLWVDFILAVAPSIVSTISLEFTSLQVTVVALNGANFSLSKASLGVSLELELVPELQMTEEQRIKLREAQRSKARGWKDRLSGSIARTFQAAWKGRRGYASTYIKLENFTVFNPSPPESRSRTQSIDSIDSGWVQFMDIAMEAPDNAVLHVPGETMFNANCSFDPFKGKVAKESTSLQILVPEVTVFVDVLSALLDDIKDMLPPPHERPLRSPIASPQSSGFFSSPPSTPMTPYAPPTSSRRQEPTSQNYFMNYFKYAAASIPRITLQYLSTKSREPIQYKSQIIGLDLGLKLGDPAKDPIHVKWLGKSGSPSLETCVAWCKFTDIIIHRDNDLRREETLVRIVKTAGMDAQILLHHFPSSLLAPSDDPTAAFVACEIIMDSIEATETLDLLRKRLARPKASSSQPTTRIGVFTKLPRMSVDIQVRDIKGRILCDDPKFAHDVGVDVTLDAVEFHIRSNYESFKAPQTSSKSKGYGVRRSECFPTMTFSTYAAVHSPLIRTCHALPEEDGPHVRSKLGAPSHGGNTKLDDPIFLVDGLELSVSGNLLGKWNGTEEIVLDRNSTMLDARLIADVVHVELWTLSSLEVLTHVVSQLKAARAKSRPTQEAQTNTTRTTILDHLPSGIQFHAAMPSLTVGVTGRDLNPDCSLELYRGILLHTGAVFSYVCMQSSLHNARARSRFKNAISQDRLRLPEGLLTRAFAFSTDADYPKAVSALTETLLTTTTVRRIVGTQFGVEETVLEHPLSNVGPSHLTLLIPQIRTVGYFTRRLTLSKKLVDKILFTPEISAIMGHFQLLDAYCMMLAMHTVQQTFDLNSRKPLAKPAVSLQTERSGAEIELAIQIASLQLGVLLPHNRRLHIRGSILSLGLSEVNKVEARWSSLSVFVPSELFKAVGKYEELARLPSWKLTALISPESSNISIQVVADCARIRIPNGFILSDTILAITVMVKACKLLLSVVKSGKYSNMPSPPSEGPKRVPEISVTVGCLLFEANDTPLDAKVNLALRNNLLAQRIRLEHEDAFEAKVARIESTSGKSSRGVHDWNFSAQHTVGIEDARQKLRQLFSTLWISHMRDARANMVAREEKLTMRFREGKTVHMNDSPIEIHVPPSVPPLFRLTLTGVHVNIKQPDWKEGYMQDFMEDLGGGLPRDTQFTLLIPMDLKIHLDSGRFSIRDLPLPLFHIPPHNGGRALTFETSLVIGEEIGPETSVRWVDCEIAASNADAPGAVPFVTRIPKTTMPVKSYASPVIRVHTTGITDMCWGVSFLPVMQDVMRVVDSLTTLSVDPSPTLGFWDKLRLIFHWRIEALFQGELHFHSKGSRDAWQTTGNGVGLGLCSRKNTRLLIGHPNKEKELIQLLSDDMLIVIPTLSHFDSGGDIPFVESHDHSERKFQKVIAKLVHGVRLGIGFVFERACTSECDTCPKDADVFHRSCRNFDFKPHYEVFYTTKRDVPSNWDSFRGFRSDFIHFSASLHSPSGEGNDSPNGIHLSPRVFSHFWSWLRLFDDTLSLPIRHGPMWPDPRPPSKKLGRHLATLKYRLCLDNTTISHTYKQDSEESWANGEVPCVGVKAHVRSFRADLHQRDQEMRTKHTHADGSEAFKYTRSRSFYGAEVCMNDIFLRAIVGVFKQPELQHALPHAHYDHESPYQIAPRVPITDPLFDIDDYIELDWTPIDPNPKFYMGDVASCPQFTFVKKIEEVRKPSDDPKLGAMKMSKFGSEDSHVCLLGMGLDPRLVQLDMAKDRKHQLEEELELLDEIHESYTEKKKSLDYRISLLSSYIQKLSNPASLGISDRTEDHLHGDWTETDWGSFENLYYVHAPRLSLTNGTRNILLQYYYESRKRRGFEYHMASSAVRFIREQALAMEAARNENVLNSARNPVATPNRSAKSVKRFFTKNPETRKEHEPVVGPLDVDPSLGEVAGLKTRRNHFCLLFKPQIVLRSDLDDESVIIISANDAVLQSTYELDKIVEDPINGHLRTRNHLILSGMQLFTPSAFCTSLNVQLPFEVFLDDLCETVEYDRIVMHTSCMIQYDRYNRLRLHMSSSSAPQSDSLWVNVPRFTLQANSGHFSSLHNVVTDLLLYADPSNRTRLNRLEAFILNEDISDSSSTAEEIAIRQARIRSLGEYLTDLSSRQNELKSHERAEMVNIAASLMHQTEELGLIFDAIQIAQDREVITNRNKIGVRLEASSSDLTWNLLDVDGSLLSKLSVRGLDFTWVGSQDGSTSNRLKVKDLEAVDARPNAKFPEMISKNKRWLSSNPMTQKDLLLDVVWNTAAPVGGISILTNFDLSFHPINVQFDVSVGYKIQTYMFPKDKTLRYHSSSDAEAIDGDRSGSESPVVAFRKDISSIAASRPSTEADRALLKAPSGLKRSPSQSSLSGDTAPVLRRSRSTHALVPVVASDIAPKPKIHDGVAEMRARSAENRTFVSARINPAGICLTFRRDRELSVIIPDITDLYFETPMIEFGNRTCSFRDLLVEFKWDLISKTGNILLSSGGLKSFQFSGIKDWLKPTKRVTAESTRPPINRQITFSKTSSMKPPSRPTTPSSTAETSTMHSTSSGATLRSNTNTPPPHRMNSTDSNSSTDHTGTETPRRRLMSLFHKDKAQQSPSRRAATLPPSQNPDPMT